MATNGTASAEIKGGAVRLKRKSITKRWLFNILGVIFIILVALLAVVSFGVKTYYYDAAAQAIYSRLALMERQMNEYSDYDSDRYMDEILKLVEGFEDRDKMECMAINQEGTIIITSSGFSPEGETDMPDFTAAMSSTDGYGEYQGRFPQTDEGYYAVTVRSPVQTSQVAAIRMVVSLQLIDRQILFIIAMATVICLGILGFVGFSGSYFISSIVIPVRDVGRTAKSISAGNFSVRIPKQRDDEIGDLCDTINQMAQELGTAEEMKNEFISSVSHELRTPLTAIKGWGETIKMVETEDPTIQKGIRVILSEADRLNLMVEELLDFSNMQSGRIRVQMEQLDLGAELEDAVLMYEERAKREGILLTFDCPAHFISVLGDRNRLRQVFVNVLDNALKYSELGGRVDIAVEETGRNVVVRVEDHGCGIKAEDLPKVKTKFYKANYKKRGSGIGLAVADEIVRLHGGTLSLESVEGEGTTVIISLPRKLGENPKREERE